MEWLRSWFLAQIRFVLSSACTLFKVVIWIAFYFSGAYFPGGNESFRKDRNINEAKYQVVLHFYIVFSIKSVYLTARATDNSFDMSQLYISHSSLRLPLTLVLRLTYIFVLTF